MGGGQGREVREYRNFPMNFGVVQASPEEHSGEYDIVVDIDKIKEGKQGWPIYLSKKLQHYLIEEYEKLIQFSQKQPSSVLKVNDEDSNDGSVTSKVQKSDEEEHITEKLLKLLDLNKTNTIVSVSGLFNRGKTFLLNKLGKTSLPSDMKVNTKGLSFVLPDDDNVKNLIFLDTAGTNSPLQLSSEDRKNSALVEKKSTELFLQDLVYSLSDVIIVVVNQLTWPDQEYLEVIQEKMRKSEKVAKQLYVVHNFSDVKTERDLLLMWRKYVLRSYVGTQKTVQINIGGKAETARYFVTRGQNITHVFMANDQSPAGKMWNPRTIELLRTWLKGKHSTTNKPLPELIIEQTQHWLKTYCRQITNVSIVKNITPEFLYALELPAQVDKEELESYSTSVSSAPSTAPPPKKSNSRSNPAKREEKTRVQNIQSKSPNLISGTPPNPTPRPPQIESISEEEWDKYGDDLKPLPKPKGVFSLVVDGNMDLIKEKIEYHGYHITLSQQNQYQPPIDIIEDDDGMTIVIDLPGFRPEEDEDGEVDQNDEQEAKEHKQAKLTKTGGTVNVTIDRAIRNVIITGSRVLSFPKVIYGDGEYSFGEIQGYEQKSDCERTFGLFERRVPIPDKYELDTDPFFTLDEGQGIIYVKTAKKTKKVRPVRLKVSKKN
eukprot:TRINITY_DN4095_c0_g1_i1.p1 TRINITY_DN4095_c0_g1~~TRINITY_DN4095_c0_g1_i1.p1  ORF type:complete len:658 (-),score=136.28 TRINITY_DN4095_c0_g1_i1:27-2000(-)